MDRRSFLKAMAAGGLAVLALPTVFNQPVRSPLAYSESDPFQEIFVDGMLVRVDEVSVGRHCDPILNLEQSLASGQEVYNPGPIYDTVTLRDSRPSFMSFVRGLRESEEVDISVPYFSGRARLQTVNFSVRGSKLVVEVIFRRDISYG